MFYGKSAPAPRISISLIAFFLVSPQTQASDTACTTLKKIEAEWNQKLPAPIDRTTEMIQLKINCETRTAVYVKRLLVNSSAMAVGWRPRKQRQHTQLHCNRAGLASQGGWTVVDDLYDFDFNYVAAFVTRPQDCPLGNR